jgi:hypothetical protein
MTVKTLKAVASHSAPESYKPPFQIELAPGAAKGGIRYCKLVIMVPEGAVTVEKVEAVKFDGTVLAGFASTVKTAENLTTYQYLVNYTYALHRVEGAGLLKAVWSVESTPTVSSTPVIHYVTAGKPLVVEADRSIVRVLDSAGGDVAASKSDTYTVARAGNNWERVGGSFSFLYPSYRTSEKVVLRALSFPRRSGGSGSAA